MLKDLIREDTFLEDIVCSDWRELVEIAGGLLVNSGDVTSAYLRSIQETVDEFGAYMVLIDDIAFFHGLPEAGVNRLSMSLALLRDAVFLKEKRIKAAFVFAAPSKEGHIELLSELAERLQDEKFVEILRSGGPKQAIFDQLRGNAQDSEL